MTTHRIANSAAATERYAYLRQASLSADGSRVTFSCGGDIWICDGQGGDARRMTAHEDYDAAPIFSPDDRLLAFASRRTGGENIYLMALNSREVPRRLTYHHYAAPPACWSPDGQWIYFTSGYDGISGAIYKIHVDGGTPVRIYGDPMAQHFFPAVSPDGKWLAFNNNGNRWWRNGKSMAEHSDIWLMRNQPDGGGHQRLNQYRGRNLKPMWSPDSSQLYYISDRSDGVENIWRMPLKGVRRAEALTDFRDGRVLRPAISADGKWIVFERHFQLWLLEVDSRQAHPLEIRLQVDEKENSRYHYATAAGIDEFQLSPDGKKVGFVVRGNVYADIASKDRRGPNSFTVTGEPSRESQLCWSADSKHLFYLSDRTGDNQIFHYDFVKRRETQLTDSAIQKYQPKVSPDDKWLSYIRNNSEIWLMNSETREERAFVTGQIFLELPYGADYTWSPDSQWIAFASWDQNFFCNIHVQHIDENAPRQISFLSNQYAGNLHWSPDGKYIIFNTGHYRREYQIARIDLEPILPKFKEDDFDKLFRDPDKDKSGDNDNDKEKNGDGNHGDAPESAPETADPAIVNPPSAPGKKADAANVKKNSADGDSAKNKVKIVFEGIKRRIRFLTNPEDFARVLAIRPDSKLLIYRADVLGRPCLWSMSMEAERLHEYPRQLTTSGSYARNAFFIPDGKKLFYLENGMIYSMGITDDGERKSGPSSLNTRAELEVDFHREKMQVFDEAWRLIRDHFYDPAYHGCDWNQVYALFRPVAHGTHTDDEFLEVLRLMLGELNASHLGADGWWGRGAPDSYLGLDFDQKQLEKKGVFKIRYVLPEAPLRLAENPAREGEYLVEVDGVPLDGKTVNLPALLQRKSGKRVKIKLNSRASLKGAREVFVKPIGIGNHNFLRYRDWVQRNQQYVLAKSDGRLGYIHIPAMGYRDYMNFIVDLDTEAHNKEGIVIDVRFNPGGHIAAFILDVLSRKSFVRSSLGEMINTGGTNFAGGRILEKPLILVTNEQTASNAEMFSEGFRRLGLGKVVGKPTAGAVISTQGWHLLDGTWFRLPRFKIATMEGENTELKPRPVDIDVDRPLGESAKGIDSQLDAAVGELLRQITPPHHASTSSAVLTTPSK